MKRLYLRPAFRGQGIGRVIAERLISEAKRIGYTLMRLDTIPTQMPEANRLYHSLGFYETSAYYDNPHLDATYMELPLAPVAKAKTPTS